MSFFDLLGMVGGLSLFLFGMNFMGKALERRAGNKLESFLGRLTTRKLTGFFTGLAITSVVQSSTATTVMVVGFVNSGIMTLRQAINVIMGANVGTTATAWLLSLGGVGAEGGSALSLLSAKTFTPILALVGIIFYLFAKKDPKRDTGAIFLGFATLMNGMEIMSGAVSGLSESAKFGELFLLFENPLLGMVAGAILTAIVQSSSAAIGILQALAVTGKITYGAAVPIIMGQNIGTCVTAMLSAIGATKNAKRAAIVHLSFNVIGSAVWLAVFSILRAIFAPQVLGKSAELFGIAITHTVFNLLCTLLLLPMSGFLERLAVKIVPDPKVPEKTSELDIRLLATPSVALERARALTVTMASGAVGVLKHGLKTYTKYSEELAADIRKNEDKTDRYEDILSSYLARLGGEHLGASEGLEVTRLMRVVGDFERISDCGVRLLNAAEEIRDKEFVFPPEAYEELSVLSAACSEVHTLALSAFTGSSGESIYAVRPLADVIDSLKEEARVRQIMRLQKGVFTVEAGFVWSDILRSIEESADLCTNIAACMGDIAEKGAAVHRWSRMTDRINPTYEKISAFYTEKYSI